MKSETKVYIDPSGFGVDIRFVRWLNGKPHVARPIELIFDEHAECDLVEPTLRLGMIDAHYWLEALAEALDKSGIKTDKDAKSEGLLEATKYHLEDMRELMLGVDRRRTDKDT